MGQRCRDRCRVSGPPATGDGKRKGLAMTKKIEAIIREDALDAVKDALHDIGIVGMNVFEVRGHGRQGGIEMAWRGTSYRMDLLPKIQLNIILSDYNVDKTIDAITAAARTGNEGDGIIFIYPVEDVVRIRTGERGHAAIMYPGDIDTRGKK
jgi:nitrogen regulatory protein P-II 1